MNICDYGCGNKANYKFKNGRICCENNISKCPRIKKKKFEKLIGHFVSLETKKKISKARKGQTSPRKGIKLSLETRNKISETRKIRGIGKGTDNPNYGNKLTISRIKKRYPFFSKIEEMRYNPENTKEKEIQVHCKNHNCTNSKEKDGWFTPSYVIFYERVRALEKQDGSDGAYFYCSDQCKDICPLYSLKYDPYSVKNIQHLYTQSEYNQFRNFILQRDNYICQFCGQEATEVHHERPQKIEPFFALDPDFAWSSCKICHYEKGHKDECSTGNLAKINCGVKNENTLKTVTT